MNTVLFLCTGNYYRSRFAEYLFNDRAVKCGLAWQASSRGLALERGKSNVGAVSQHALAGLTERSVEIAPDLRHPISLTEADLTAADKIIAVDRSEHRPLIAERFPRWLDVVDYWLVHDVGQTSPSEALCTLEQNVQSLLRQLP